MTFIRSSKHSLKFTNSTKLDNIELLVFEYKLMVSKFVDVLWKSFDPLSSNPKLLDSDICNSIYTGRINDSRLRQCAAKQACSLVNAVLTKRRKQLYKLKELMKENKNTKKLQKRIDTVILQKPRTDNIGIELDGRFIDFKQTPDGHFSMFVRLSSIGDKLDFNIPIQDTVISKKWSSQGKLLNESCLLIKICIYAMRFKMFQKQVL